MVLSMIRAATTSTRMGTMNLEGTMRMGIMCQEKGMKMSTIESTRSCMETSKITLKTLMSTTLRTTSQSQTTEMTSLSLRLKRIKIRERLKHGKRSNTIRSFRERPTDF